MTRRSFVTVPLVLCLAHAGAVLGQAPPPLYGSVAVPVRRPDGTPLAKAAVRIDPIDTVPFGMPVPHVATATDAAGVARFDWPVESHQVRVSADGVGVAPTGLFAAVPGKTVDVPLPPLAAFAVVDGVVSAGRVSADETVVIGYGASDVTAAVDATGHFHAEVPGGTWFAFARAGDQRVAQTDTAIRVAWGQTRSGLALVPVKPIDTRAWSRAWIQSREQPSGSTTVWATGTVRDTQGRPVAGVRVDASANYNAGKRMSQQSVTTTTDTDGHYAVRGPGGLDDGSAKLIASKPGLTPAMAWIAFPEPRTPVTTGTTQPTTRAAMPDAPVRDFVLTAHGGGLDVVVRHDGKPAIGASVCLSRDGSELRDRWAASANDKVDGEIEQIVNPQAVAGDDGVAHFTDLLPGRYTVIAAGRGPLVAGELKRRAFPPEGDQPRATAAGVVVRAGETRTQTMTVYPQPNAVRLAVARPDGTPLTGDQALDFAHVPALAGVGTTMKFDAHGVGRYTFDGPGLWHVSVKYRDVPLKTISVSPPSYAADAIVAVSALLDPAIAQPMTAFWAEPGVVRVEVRDAAGKPADGVVSLARYDRASDRVGTAVKGRVDFHGLPEGTTEVSAQIRDAAAPELGGDLSGRGDGALPDDAALTGRTFVPTVAVAVRPLSDQTVTLRELPAAYVRGRLHPSAGISTRALTLYVSGENAGGDQMHYRPDTGEFVAGPFPSGDVSFCVGRFGTSTGQVLLQQSVRVTAGTVVHVDLVLPATPPAAAVATDSFQRRPIAGRVFLSDGRTPAYGAALDGFDALRPQPDFGGATDVAGNILTQNRTVFSLPPSFDAPTGPVLVARLPGVTGGTVIDLAGVLGPLSVVLPPAVSARGTLTVGGRSPAGLHGQLRVLAACQGRGKLNALLSIHATPQDDGTFALEGLTPGRYLVQADLDGLWLSPAVPLTVTTTDPPTPHLDIPRPAGPVRLTLTDPAGRPAVARRVTVDRPPGPLTAADWPDEFMTDGAGAVTVPALETGTHTLHVGGRAIDVSPPPLPCTRPAEFELRLSE